MIKFNMKWDEWIFFISAIIIFITGAFGKDDFNSNMLFSLILIILWLLMVRFRIYDERLDKIEKGD